MNITIRLFGESQAQLAARQLALPDGATIDDALSTVWELRSNTNPACTSNAAGMDAMILVNGRNAETLGGEARTLNDGDRLIVTPPLGGG